METASVSRDVSSHALRTGLSEMQFEDEAQRVCDHQNKYKQWENQGGIVKHLTLGKI